MDGGETLGMTVPLMGAGRGKRMRTRWSNAGRWSLVGLALVLLAACYVPNRFISEIRLGQTGDFAIYYKGDLTWAPLYRDIKKGAVKAEDIPQKIDEIRADLARDKNFKSIEPVGDGTFRVEYQRQGHLSDSEQVTFVRRNAIILMIRSFPDGRITVNGNTIKPSDAQVATSLGLEVQGEFRITTDGLVLENNATSVKTINGYPVYIWTIQNAFSPAPHLVMQRAGAFPRKGQSQK